MVDRFVLQRFAGWLKTAVALKFACLNSSGHCQSSLMKLDSLEIKLCTTVAVSTLAAVPQPIQSANLCTLHQISDRVKNKSVYMYVALDPPTMGGREYPAPSAQGQSISVFSLVISRFEYSSNYQVNCRHTTTYMCMWACTHTHTHTTDTIFTSGRQN